MSRQAKRTNKIYFGPNDFVVFAELPEGFFYKGRFHRGVGVWAELKKDGEVRSHDFPNGKWQYGDIVFPSLRELYDYYCEDKISMPYSELKSRYQELGITHDPCGVRMYSYDRDDYNLLYLSKAEVLYELNGVLIESEEAREERFLEPKSREECVEYFQKPMKERIRLLEELE